ncbi:NAD-dependent epimerase/dehydratase family protein [Mesorhizobium sp. BR1-1-16]|uniref:NAD-dependent epimerase/dehydratase family protein n=1 Tax=Mesorhizobium sp. BR1-1-16 TaxID=2876653 RepID=UPI001CCD7BE6|nr:NAD-dependent epimerase/dehydratase family protein [Mesorhizobium sp. BR1-1-16]MBZ9936966.1 NAD-dependent epimerase/dehydratase family protein [Mesorhizobium sp. BR1-1-16]
MRPSDDAEIAVVGGCGFIGCNLADALLARGRRVVLIDNLSRPGVETNLDWLLDRHRGAVRFVRADIRDGGAMQRLLRDAAAVFHFAAQTAVTTSLDDPLSDFEANARGTLNVLEAVRRAETRAPLIFASTNKVYGALDDIPMMLSEGRYRPRDPALATRGLDESLNLEFRTPYGCSKGAADQYVLDYGASFGMRTAVLRMSCIYGPRQFGTEDQGWVAHLLKRAINRQPVTIFGDGCQVRDVLHVKDAVAAYLAVFDGIDRCAGRAFNLGGGPSNSISLMEFLELIGTITGSRPSVRHAPRRAGDQVYFVADSRRLNEAVGWTPEVDWRDGARDLADWLSRHRKLPLPAGTERLRA